MSVTVVGVAAAAEIRAADQVDPKPNVLGKLVSGEMIFTEDLEDLADVRGRDSRLTEQGMVLRTKRGEFEGRSGTYAWAETQEQATQRERNAAKAAPAKPKED